MDSIQDKKLEMEPILETARESIKTPRLSQVAKKLSGLDVSFKESLNQVMEK